MPTIKAIIFECSLKPSPAPSSTHKLAVELADVLQQQGATTEYVPKTPEATENATSQMAKNLVHTATMLRHTPYEAV